MLIIGEKINIANRLLYEAIRFKDMSSIQSLILSQVEMGADVLDVNLAPEIAQGEKIMQQVVTVIQQYVDLPLCLMVLTDAILNPLDKLVMDTGKTVKLLIKIIFAVMPISVDNFRRLFFFTLCFY